MVSTRIGVRSFTVEFTSLQPGGERTEESIQIGLLKRE